MEWKPLIVAFFYNEIKKTVESILGNFVGMIPSDLLMALIGWYLKEKTSYKWLGEGILYGAIASLGATTGFGLANLFRTQTQTNTQKQVMVAGVKF